MLLISDANILIDMADGGLLEQMFLLPETFAISDVLFQEELIAHHAHLVERGLILKALTGEGVAEAYRLKALCPGRDAPSQNDLFALMLARQEQCPLLTGDRRLRGAAARYHPEVDVRGTLWLVQRLKDEGLITAQEAAAAYGRMKDAGSRLPWKEVERQLAGWGS
jgi:hypothetical protein